MKEGMEVRVLPTQTRRMGHLGRPATLLELPTRPRGRARVRFVAGGTAMVPIGRIVKGRTIAKG